MTMLVLETPEGVDLSREIAGPGSRSAAAILDVIVLAAGYLVLLLLALLAESNGLSGIPSGVLQGGTVLIPCLYPGICGILFDGQTFGKKLMGLRVVGDGGYPADALQHILRSLLWPIELALWIPMPLGLILIGITERRQRLGDMIAGTVVVREPRLLEDREPFRGESWSRLARRSLDLSASRVAVLERPDYELLRTLLMRTGMQHEARRKLMVRTARYYDQRLELGGF
ncbi:MAG: putative RDD family membrane protein YckC, partial [Planctomycetota bacterium]